MFFQNANEVRRFLKEKGFTKVRVRLVHNPFGGENLFFVKRTDLPENVAVVTQSLPGEPMHFFSSDGGKTAKMLVDLREALNGTNARVG
jgi:hypothetical protein